MFKGSGLFNKLFSIAPKPQSGGRIIEKYDMCMSTVVSQAVYGENAEKACDEVSDEIRRLEKLMSAYLPESEISMLNSMAGKGYVSLSSDTVQVLMKSVEYSRLSDGMFDVSSGPLTLLWSERRNKNTVPSTGEIHSLLDLINYSDIMVDHTNCSAMLLRQGQKIDVGGIAKGYAADRAADIYGKYGIESALINLGGNVKVVGRGIHGLPWKIGIQDPRGKYGKLTGYVEVSGKTVVTSGDYERYIIINGVRYHHIINPWTGYPANSGIISVTVVSESSIDADAMSTALFIMGVEKGLSMIRAWGNTEAVFITDDGEIIVTLGLKDSFILADKAKQISFI